MALVPPPGLFRSLQALRRLLGDPRVDVLAPHVTLVAPVDLPADSVAAALRVIEDAAARTTPFRLDLGPAASFAPDTPTLHLSVGGDVVGLHDLRDRLRAAPLDRPDRRPFVPHLTLVRAVEDRRVLDGAVSALSGVLGSWDVDRVVLLEHRPVRDDEPGGVRRWRPIADAALGPPAVVGRGGVELLVRTGAVLTPGAAELCGLPAPVDTLGHLDGCVTTVHRHPPDPTDADGPIGVLAGRVHGALAEVDALVVAPGHRRQGVARHLVARWCGDAAARGAQLASAGGLGPEVTAVLVGLGFVRVGDRLVRSLGPSG